MKPKIVLPGGSGFLGKSTAEYFFNKGYSVIILTRGKSVKTTNAEYVNWDGKSLGEWTKHIEGAEAVINFTGKSVNCIYTPENKKEIIDSRIDSVKIVADVIKHAKKPPEVLIQSASLAIYGDTIDVCSENAPHGSGFSVNVCELWEKEFFKENLPGTRKILLRIGFVLGRNGGALETLSKLTRRYLGGAIASGEQFISWLHIEDLNRMFEFIIENKKSSGIYNATGTTPTKNKDFMKSLRKALHKPWSPPVPIFAVKIGARFFMKTDSSLALTGRNCIPVKFLKEGFKFNYTNLETALENTVR